MQAIAAIPSNDRHGPRAIPDLCVLQVSAPWGVSVGTQIPEARTVFPDDNSDGKPKQDYFLEFLWMRLGMEQC
jgi:hypothetical protein